MATPLEQSIAQAQTYGRLVIKYKWHILVGTLALTLVFTMIIAKLPSIYEATTTILVDPQQLPEKYVSPAANSDPYSRLNTLTQQVLGRTRLQEIIDKLNPYPERRGAVSPEQLIAQMRDDIMIQVKQGSGPELSTFTVTYLSKQPTLAAEVANELANSFIQWNIDSRAQQVSRTKDFLSSELEEAKQNLEQQEDKLRQFKMSHLGETPDQTVNNLQALSGLRSALQANADAMNRADERRILLTRSPEPTPQDATDTFSNLTERGRLLVEKHRLEAAILQLREHDSEIHPDVVRATARLEEINARLESLPPDPSGLSPDASGAMSAGAVQLELIDKEMKRLNTENNHIQSQIAAYQAKIDATPIREQELVGLTRNYDISKQHYQALLDQGFNIDMAADLDQKQKTERFRVLDPAKVPEKPIRPKRKLLIPLSSTVAFGLSIFSVLAKEELSPAVKTEVELKSLLPRGTRIIGLIPRIEIASEARRDRQRAIVASVVCIVLCLATITVIWEMHRVL